MAQRLAQAVRGSDRQEKGQGAGCQGQGRAGRSGRTGRAGTGGAGWRGNRQREDATPHAKPHTRAQIGTGVAVGSERTFFFAMIHGCPRHVLPVVPAARRGTFTSPLLLAPALARITVFQRLRAMRAVTNSRNSSKSPRGKLVYKDPNTIKRACSRIF